MVKVMVVCSGKGGVGKTVTSLNLAASFKQLGRQVTVVDANLTAAHIALHLGAVVPITLNHVLAGRRNASEAVYLHESGIKILPASINLNDLKQVRLENFAGAIAELRRMNDIIIIDSAAGLGKEAMLALGQADDVIIVTQPEMPSVVDAMKTVNMAERMNKHVAGIIVARTGGKHSMSLKNISQLVEKPIIGEIPEDENVSRALEEKEILVDKFPKSKASVAYMEIAQKILDSY